MKRVEGRCLGQVVLLFLQNACVHATHAELCDDPIKTSLLPDNIRFQSER